MSGTADVALVRRRLAAPRPLAVALALVVVYLAWGSTAPAISIAVRTIPSWAMVALRFGIAGAILWAWTRARGVAMPTRREWMFASLTGIVLLVLGNGVFAWTLTALPSGIGALFFALAPLFMAIFAFAFYRERVSRVAAAGVAVGLAGMVFLYSPSGAQHLPTLPTVLGMLSSVAWALGSILQRRLRGSDVVQTSAMQMLVASAVLAAIALASGERLSAAAFTPAAIGSLLYLVVLGSIVGFSAFLWLLEHVETTLASTYSYVNPIVSLAIGIGVLHEPFSWRLAAGGAVIVCGVAIMLVAPPPERTVSRVGPPA